MQRCAALTSISWKQNRAVVCGVFDLVPDHLHTLGFFDDPKREVISDTVDKLNKHFKKQHLVYFGGLHGLEDAAPTRIPFFSVPKLSDF
jgi:hypothetical protein